MVLNCPACGAEVVFKARLSVYCVCSYCASMLVRHDLNLEHLGKMAELPADVSPLQIGTRGQYQGQAFEIIGRLKVGWEQGTWNEWHLAMSSAGEGWLAEAQGHYMIILPAPIPPKLPPAAALRPGTPIPLHDGRFYEVTDIKEATCLGSEGELPFPAPKGRTSISVDLSGPGGVFATLDYAKEGVRVYAGRYVELEELSLTQLRQIDGW